MMNCEECQKRGDWKAAEKKVGSILLSADVAGTQPVSHSDKSMSFVAGQ
jgi:hypothetical protein